MKNISVLHCFHLLRLNRINSATFCLHLFRFIDSSVKFDTAILVSKKELQLFFNLYYQLN